MAIWYWQFDRGNREGWKGNYWLERLALHHGFTMSLLNVPVWGLRWFEELLSPITLSLRSIYSRNTQCPWTSECAYSSASSVMKLHPTGMFPYWKRQRAANWRMPDPNDILKAFEILRWKALYKNKVLLLPRQRKMHEFSVSIQEPNIAVPSAPLWYFVCI